MTLLVYMVNAMSPLQCAPARLDTLEMPVKMVVSYSFIVNTLYCFNSIQTFKSVPPIMATVIRFVPILLEAIVVHVGMGSVL